MQAKEKQREAQGLETGVATTTGWVDWAAAAEETGLAGTAEEGG